MKTLITLLALTATLYTQAAEHPDLKTEITWADKIGLDTLAVARTTDMERFEFSAAARLSYDLTARLALVGEIEWSEFSGKTLVDSTLAGLKFSFPTRIVRPYLIGGIGWKLPANAEYLAGGGGLEVALGKSWRVFAEALAEKTVNTDASLRVGGGVGFRF